MLKAEFIFLTQVLTYMLEKYNLGKFDVQKDDEHFRYIIKPLRKDGTLSLANALFAIKKSTKVSYKTIAEYIGLTRANAVFKLIYGKAKRESYVDASKFLVVDTQNWCAYLYDKDHEPEQVVPAHIGPTLVNNEVDTIVCVERVPVIAISRVQIKDPYDRQLTMTLTPAGGYLLGIADVTLCTPNVPYVVTGNASALNKLLKTVQFVAIESGKATVDIVVDDGAGKVNSRSAAQVKLNVTAADNPSEPVLTTPESVTANTETYVDVSGIKVTDEDGKIIEIKIAPFGCQLVGFKSYLFPISEGETRAIAGTPETINNEVAKLQVKLVEDNAFIGVSLISGTNVTTQYIRLSTGESSTPGSNTPETPETPEAPQAEEPTDVDETVEDLPGTPTLNIQEAILEGVAGSTVDLGVSFSGDANDRVTVFVQPQDCSITLASGAVITAGTSKKFSNTVTVVNNKLAGAKVNVGEQQGLVSVTYDNQTQTITVAVVTE